MKDTFVSYFKSKHKVLQTWLEECICDPSVGLKQTACVSFFQCLCSFLMIWRIIFLNPLKYILRFLADNEIQEELMERQILVIKDWETPGNVLSEAGSWGQQSFLNAPAQVSLRGGSEHGDQARAMSSGCVSFGLPSFTSVTRLVFFRMEMLWHQL